MYSGKCFTEDVFIMFRTKVAQELALLYQKSEDYPGKVALMAQFMPTFDKGSRRKKLLVQEEELDEIDLPKELDSIVYQFIFVVDRSGSMG